MKRMKRIAMIAGLVVAGAAASGCSQTGRTLGEHVDDGWIATKTRMHLMTHGFGQQMNVNIDVLRGVVTIKGEVHNEADKARIEELVRQVVGVRDVENRLQVVAEDLRPSSEPGRRWQERPAARTSY